MSPDVRFCVMCRVSRRSLRAGLERFFAGRPPAGGLAKPGPRGVSRDGDERALGSGPSLAMAPDVSLAACRHPSEAVYNQA
jgi:hypothetical protein